MKALLKFKYVVISINLDKHAVCHSQLIIPVELFLVAATKSARELFALLQELANFKQCQANEKEKKNLKMFYSKPSKRTSSI